VFLAFPPHLSYQMMCPVGCCWHLLTFHTRTRCRLPLLLLFYQLFHCLRFLCGFLPSSCVQVLHWLQ
jgi:hypothetical protein